MSVEIDGPVVRLTGRCGAAEAETLLAALAGGAERIDLSACEQLHAALFQLLMASGAEVTGSGSDFIGRWLLPSLANAADEARKDG